MRFRAVVSVPGQRANCSDELATTPVASRLGGTPSSSQVLSEHHSTCPPGVPVRLDLFHRFGAGSFHPGSPECSPGRTILVSRTQFDSWKIFPLLRERREGRENVWKQPRHNIGAEACHPTGRTMPSRPPITCCSWSGCKSTPALFPSQMPKTAMSSSSQAWKKPVHTSRFAIHSANEAPQELTNLSNFNSFTHRRLSKRNRPTRSAMRPCHLFAGPLLRRYQQLQMRNTILFQIGPTKKAA